MLLTNQILVPPRWRYEQKREPITSDQVKPADGQDDGPPRSATDG